jgi:hypothetical protein
MDFIPPLQEDVQIIVQERFQRTLIFQLQAILCSQLTGPRSFSQKLTWLSAPKA